MLSQAEISDEIARLESQEASWQNCERLAHLYALRREAGTSERFPHGDSEFLQAVQRFDAQYAWSVMDELMSVLRVVNPRLYAGVMRKLED